MVDILFAALSLINVPLFALALWYGYKIMRISGHSPWGWTLIYVAFSLVFARTLYRIGVVLTASGSAAPSDFYFDLLTGYPAAILIVAGVYLLHKKFQKHIEKMQGTLEEHQQAESKESMTPTRPG